MRTAAEGIAALAGLLLVLTCLLVGGRLLRMARSTRRAPELLIGIGLVMTGGLWSPLVAIGRQATALADPLRAALAAALSAASCLWLAFLPPAAYVERIRRRAVAA